MDKRLIVSLGIMLLVFALYHGGYFGTTLYSMLGQTRGSDERQQGGIVDVTYNESCVTVKFINLGYKYGPNHPGDYNIWVLLKRPNPQWICDVEFLECWGVPTDLLDKINWGRVVGSYQCYTGCPAPQLSARFEDLPQEFFREKGGRISEAVGVKFTEWKCPPIVYCKSAHGFHGEGKLILCYKEAECYTDQDCIDKYKNCDYYCEDGRCIAKTVTHPPKTCPDGSIVKWIGYPTCDYEECPEIPEEEEVQPTPTPQPINWRATIIGIVVIILVVAGAVWYLRRR